ncbi:PRC-barrel domain containing protein [Dankookia rubra]|uniref:PRC-barrel domain containing protein n=1 Tax=Dankookia rubra TaxID=1442381 RepID=A0A4R5QDA2_9PROT|nr:PRC-barrel domain-containing protein [Dankookia rubra]TDH60337.1 PRC-barrel domain containing protein [Dankookia rubra]
MRVAMPDAVPPRRRAAVLWLAVIAPLPWAVGAAAQAPTTAPALNETIPAGSVLRLLGRDVTGPKGEVVAQVMNVLVNAAGQPQAAVLDYGGFLGVGKRRIAVAWRALRFAPDQQTGAITLGFGPDQLKAVPEFKPDGPLIVAAPAESSPPDAPPPAQD